ncbi:MAG: hypothetical protein AB7J28_15630 [Hyphomonadaceae bacterium]
MSQLIVSAASAVAVLTLIALAWLLGFRTGVRLKDEADVQSAVEAYEPGANVQHALIGADHKSALARLADGRFAAIKSMADRFAVRVFGEDALKLKRTRRGLRLEIADVGFPVLDLRFEGAPPIWLQPHVSER